MRVFILVGIMLGEESYILGVYSSTPRAEAVRDSGEFGSYDYYEIREWEVDDSEYT